MSGPLRGRLERLEHALGARTRSWGVGPHTVPPDGQPWPDLDPPPGGWVNPQTGRPLHVIPADDPRHVDSPVAGDDAGVY